MSLLVKPKPFSGESWPGYLLRLSSENQYVGIKGIAEVLKISPAALLASSPRETLLLLGIEPPVDAGPIELRKGKRASPYAAGRSIHARVCSRCLNEMKASYIKSSWDRPFELTCLQHQIFLLEACPACQMPVSYLRKNVDACDCGFKFERARGQPIDIDISQMLHVLDLQTIYASPGLTFAFAGRQEVKAYLLIRRFNQLGDGTASSLRLPAAKSIYLPLEAIRKALRWFECWPENFFRMTLLAQPRSGKAIGALILGETQRSSKVFPAIREALAALDQRRRTALRPKQRCVQVAANDQSDYVGIRFVMDATGCTYDIVQYWISNGWLGDVTKASTRKGQNEYRIPKAYVSKAIGIINSTSSVKELSRTIGLQVGALRALARHGVLQPTPYGRGLWNVRLTPSEVFLLATQLLSAASKGHLSSDRRILIDEAILRVARKTPSLLKLLIAALVERRIPIRFFGDEPTSPSELTIRQTDLQSWRRKMLERGNAA